MSKKSIEIPFGSKKLILESGKLAQQANGAVTATCGGTVVLVTACVSPSPREGIDFFPLMVEYQEKTYSAGKIPGGFFKREGRPTQKEILTSRVIDRPLRPLFPEGFRNDVQVVATVLSSDGENDPDVVALVGASAALMISDIPFDGPVGGTRVGILNGELILNPTYEQREQCECELIIAGSSEGIVMIEGEAREVAENEILKALKFGQKALGPISDLQKDLQKSIGKQKKEVDLFSVNETLMAKVKELSFDRFQKAYKIADKEKRESAIHEILDDLTNDMSIYDACKTQEEEEFSASNIKELLEQIEYEQVRRLIFEEGKRADGRGLKDLRDITSEVKVLPCTHGSSLFTRGQTQSLTTVTLGSKRDEQLIESLEGTSYKNFMLHYNFPSFSVGETRPMRGPGRREIGHGALAAKALKAVLPEKEDFPYTVRVVSEILESNGSSSMASVCAGSLALMDAGVPVKEPVAGISVGLVTKDKNALLLTDIMGLEDHFGDMDFKVAGTKNGVTAIQLDLKIKKISIDLLDQAMEQSKATRLLILDNMIKTIEKPRPDLSEFAPRILTCQIPQEKIGEVIGPGGKTIKKIMEETGAESIDIEEDGRVLVSSLNRESGEAAINIINGMMEEPEIGKTYMGEVKRVMNFGAFVQFLPGKEGLVHVSELSKEYVKDCNDAVKVGDKFKVKLIEIDKMKRVNLSKKQAE